MDVMLRASPEGDRGRHPLKESLATPAIGGGAPRDTVDLEAASAPAVRRGVKASGPFAYLDAHAVEGRTNAQVQNAMGVPSVGEGT